MTQFRFTQSVLSKAILLPFKIATSHKTREVWQNYKQEEHVSKWIVKSHLKGDLWQQ